jgi:hypothetical protein
MSALAPQAGGSPFPQTIQVGGPRPTNGPVPVGPGAQTPGQGAPGAPMSDQEWEQLVAQVALPALRKLGASAPDHQEAAVIDQCVLAIQKLLASRQSGAESALGVTPAHKAMSRAY